jgi:DNA-binding transcriptional LysR family regulator
MRGKLDANAVAMFVAVVDESSFVAASRLLGVPTSTLSRKLAELENDLGVRLLQRTTRRQVVTQQGRAFYQQCKPITVALDEARTSLTDQGQEPRGLLRITSSPLLGELLLRKPVAEFLSRYPNVEVDLFLTGRTVNVVEEGFDVALRATELHDSTLIVRRIAPSIHEVCASREFVAQYGEPRHPQELSQLPCVVHNPGPAQDKWLFEDRDGKRVTAAVQGPIRTNDLRFGEQVVRSGRAIGSFPRLLVGEALRSGELVRLLPEWSQPRRWIHALYPSRRNMSVTLRTFLDFISEQIASHPALSTTPNE